MAGMGTAHHHEPHSHDDLDAQEEAILDLLRTDGGRVTTGRRAIVRALLHGPDHHVTAEDVARMVHADHPDVHLSTIYRTLDALEDHGVVDRVILGAGGAVYHLTDHAHHHLVCEVCGAVTEVPDEVFHTLHHELEHHYGFAASTRHLALRGRCVTCRDA
jgi:Fur family ferric uptake transcriptional regulator